VNLKILLFRAKLEILLIWPATGRYPSTTDLYSGSIMYGDFVVYISRVLYRPRRPYFIPRSHLKNVSVTEICVALEILKKHLETLPSQHDLPSRQPQKQCSFLLNLQMQCYLNFYVFL